MSINRLVAVIIHNWPLKLAAIGLASLLYAGLVLSQSAQRWDARVPIVPRDQPADAVLLSLSPTDVREIRYFAPADVASRVDSSTFSAFADLSGVDPKSGSTFVAVQVVASDPAITIVDYQPSTVRVELDPLTVKNVPVTVDRGATPSGVQVGEPQTSVETVEVRGPDSQVSRVVAALARVTIQPSKLDVDAEVPLVAVDALGTEVQGVTLDPDSVRVRIRVGSTAETKSLPVNPVVTGTPAVGFEVAQITVDPIGVTVQGDADALAPLGKVDTEPVSVSAATRDVAVTVGLALPPDVLALGSDQVRVTVQVRPIAGTRTFSAGIQLAGARDDRTYTLSTDTVTVVLGGARAILDAIDPTTFRATVAVGALPPGKHTVPVVVANLPGGVSTVSIDPASIEVTVGVPASPTPSPPGSASPSPSPSP